MRNKKQINKAGLIVIAIALTLSNNVFAQGDTYKTGGNGNGSDNSKIGWTNYADFNFYTNNVKRFVIKKDGDIDVLNTLTIYKNLNILGNIIVPKFSTTKITVDTLKTNVLEVTAPTTNFNEVHINDSLRVGTSSLWLGGKNENTGNNNRIYADNGNLYIQSQTNSTYHTIISAIPLSNVGIGTTTTPGAKLDIFQRSSTNINDRLLRLTRRHCNSSPSLFCPVTPMFEIISQPVNSSTPTTLFVVEDDGRVGIGTSPGTTYKLDVAGNVRACKVEIETNSWCDYVYSENYLLMPLAELEKHLQAKKHLPGMPSEQELIKTGIDIGEMLKMQQKKIEEYSLYLIEMNKEIKALKEKVKQLENR